MPIFELWKLVLRQTGRIVLLMASAYVVLHIVLGQAVAGVNSNKAHAHEQWVDFIREELRAVRLGGGAEKHRGTHRVALNHRQRLADVRLLITALTMGS